MSTPGLSAGCTIRLVLASGSPRRNQLLALLGIPFVIRVGSVVENLVEGESPQEQVSRLSLLKANSIASQHGDELILAADTLVCLDGDILGKPKSQSHAVEMLKRLRGRSHDVYTGLALLQPRHGRIWRQSVRTLVWMRDYSDAEIVAYVDSGDPMDKAGAYAIQHPRLSPVERIEGCYTNVMGLPLCHVHCMLRQAECTLDQPPVNACNHFNRRVCAVADQVLSENCWQ